MQFSKHSGVLKKFFRNESGVISALSLFFVLVLLMIFGLAVDYANGIRVKAQMRAATDAAALAAAIDLPDKTLATQAGLEIAETYFSSSDFEQAIVASDFIYGRWESETSSFSVGQTPYDAVQVTVSRNEARSNPLPTYLLKLVGLDNLDIATTSVALAKPDSSCEHGGFFSDKNVLSGSNNGYKDGFCLYGRLGVKIGSDNSFETGVKIVMESLSDFEQGGNNAGTGDALLEDTLDLVLPGLVDGIITDMQNGNLNSLPSFITSGPVYLQEITDTTVLQPNTLYVVNDVADLGSFRTISDIAIVAGKEVKIGSNNVLYNSVFASHDKILFGSNNDIGLNSYCSTGEYSSYAFTSSNIEFGSNNYIRGMQMGSKQQIKLGSDVAGVEGVHGEALDMFDYGSADVYGGCPGGLKSGYADPTYNTGKYVSFALVQ